MGFGHHLPFADRNPIRYISRGFSGSTSSIEVFLGPRWGHVQQKGPRNARTKETPFASRGFDGTPQRSPLDGWVIFPTTNNHTGVINDVLEKWKGT
jgi:hypothetical protein